MAEYEPTKKTDAREDFERLSIEQVTPTELDEPLEVEESTEEYARRIQRETEAAWELHDSFGKQPK